MAAAAMPILAGVAGTGGAAGTVGLFGAGGALSLTAGSIGLPTLFSAVLTGASAFSQMRAGNMQASLYNMQAQQSLMSARMESLKGRQQALQIREKLERDLASQNATFAARGMLSGEGSALAASEKSQANAESDINIATFGAEMGSESEKMQAAQYGISAKSAKKSGVIDAMGTISDSKSISKIGTALLGSL